MEFTVANVALIHSCLRSTSFNLQTAIQRNGFHFFLFLLQIFSRFAYDLYEITRFSEYICNSLATYIVFKRVDAFKQLGHHAIQF